MHRNNRKIFALFKSSKQNARCDCDGVGSFNAVYDDGTSRMIFAVARVF